jgi:hypothetical protein
LEWKFASGEDYTSELNRVEEFMLNVHDPLVDDADAKYQRLRIVFDISPNEFDEKFSRYHFDDPKG